METYVQISSRPLSGIHSHMYYNWTCTHDKLTAAIAKSGGNSTNKAGMKSFTSVLLEFHMLLYENVFLAKIDKTITLFF